MRKRSRGVFTLVLLLAAAATIPPLLAQTAAGPPAEPTSRIVDRTLGEEEQIRRRVEWFFSTRRAGTETSADMAALRRAGVEFTRSSLRAQAARRALGIDSEVNFWVPLGPAPSNFGGWAFGTVSGRIASLAADWSGGTLYLGSASGGLWKSDNDGLSWTNLFDTAGTMTVGTVEVDPNDPNVIWAGTGENVVGCESYFGIGLLRSGDGGLTWESRNGTAPADLEDLSTFASIVIDPRDSSHLVTGGRIRGCSGGTQATGALYTSDDAGLTWTKRLADTQIYEIVQDPTVQDTFWAGTGSGVWKSTDNAVTWTLQTASGLPNGSTGRTEVAVSPSDSNVVYALFQSGPSFWRTTDGGASWTQMSSGSDACDGQCSYNMVLRVHRTNPDIVYRGTVHVFKSLDGGASWTDLSNNWGSSQKVHQDTHEFLMHPTDPETFYVGCDGGVWKSEDGGASFLNRNGNLNVTQFYAIGVDAADPSTVCGGAQDNSSLARSTSDVWELQQVTGDGFVCHIDPQDPSYAYITSYPGSRPNVYRSTNGVFGSFSVVTGSGSGISSGDRINWVTPYLLDPQNPATLYLGTHRVYRSDDHGSNWEQVGPSDLTGGSGSLLSLEINRNFPEVLYSGSASGRVFRTVSGGFDWTDITAGLPSRSINDLASDPTNPDRAFAVVGGFNTEHLWEWTEGTGWTARGGGLPNVPANSVLMLSADDVLVGTDTGVFRSYDGGVTFTPYMNGLPEGLVVTDLKLSLPQNLVTAGTYGRGAWQVSIDPVEPMLLYDSIELPLLELDGDGDDAVEPGETWGVRPVLRNAGGQAALGVTADLATATPGVTLLDPVTRSYGDVAPGATAASLEEYSFVVDPSFACGGEIAFDLVNVRSATEPGSYPDRRGAFSVAVVGGYGTPFEGTLLDETFDPAPPEGWTHEAVSPGVFPCRGVPYLDEWGLDSKDAAHGTSYHCGNGPGNAYSPYSYSWLYHGGKDSQDGPGILVPADAIAASLTLVHWYDTVEGQDGARVVIDAEEDDLDDYVTLVPDGGYPGGSIDNLECNGLQGGPAFQGSSGGWVTSTFDLAPYVGRRIYLAFVFGSDRRTAAGEGWWIDRVTAAYQTLGDPVCDIVRWPGTVPANATFRLLGDGTVEAAWADSCNLAELPGQTYSIQAGDLLSLQAAGTYSHAPVADDCGRISPATFTPGAGSEYYLIVPAEATREGGAGLGAQAAERPQASSVCGVQRIAPCP